MIDGMGSAQTTLSPNDSRELLAAMTRLTAPEQSDADRVREDKRAVVLTLRDLPLLVAVAQGDLALRAGGPERGPVLPTFTDTEAAEAWLRDQHPDAPPVSAMLSSHTAVGDDWLAACRERGITALALNPAGPLSTVVYTSELEQVRPRRLRRSRPPAVDPAQAAWLDLDERAAERTRVAAALAQLTERVAAGDVAGAESVADQAGALNRMLSAMVDAQLRRLGGQLRLKSGEYQHGVAELLVSANGYRLAADPLRATDAFWDAVTGLRAMRSTAGDEAMRGWAEDQLRRAREALAMLAVTGYRRDELTGWSEPEDDRR